MEAPFAASMAALEAVQGRAAVTVYSTRTVI